MSRADREKSPVIRVRAMRPYDSIIFNNLSILYVAMWILEGALRKWVPGTELFLYFARDAIYLAALTLLMLRRGSQSTRIPKFVWGAGIGITFLLIVVWLQIVLEQLDPAVAIVGFRSYVAPLFFGLGVCFFGDKALAYKIFKTVSFFACTQMPLVIVQVFSSPSSLVNAQVFSDSAYFINSGIVRATGFFSAPAGLASYCGLALASALYLVSSKKRNELQLGLLGLVSTTVIVGLGGNRLAVLGCLLVLGAFLFGIQAQVRQAGRPVVLLIASLSAIGVALVMLAPTVLDSFATRFQDASNSEDSSLRLWNQTFGFLGERLTLLGDGAGAHSQAGITLGSGQAWIEWDSSRWVVELGIFGLFMALTIVGTAAWLLIKCFAWRRDGNLGAILSSSTLLGLLTYGQITQFPSNQALFGISVGCLLLFVMEDKAPNADRVGKPFQYLQRTPNVR